MELGMKLFIDAKTWEVSVLRRYFSEIVGKMCQLEVDAMRGLIDIQPLATTKLIMSLGLWRSLNHRNTLEDLFKKMEKEVFQLAVSERLDLFLKENNEKVRKIMMKSLLSHIKENEIISVVLDDPESSRELIIKYAQVCASDAEYNIARIKRVEGFLGYKVQKDIIKKLSKIGRNLAKCFDRHICQKPFLMTAINDQWDFVSIIVKSMVFLHVDTRLPEWLLNSKRTSFPWVENSEEVLKQLVAKFFVLSSEKKSQLKSRHSEGHRFQNIILACEKCFALHQREQNNGFRVGDVVYGTVSFFPASANSMTSHQTQYRDATVVGADYDGITTKLALLDK